MATPGESARNRTAWPWMPGGVAVVLHGSPRFTADLDLVIALDRDNALRALGALAGLGYKPRAPVRAEDFADEKTRLAWVHDKGMTVFTLTSPSLPATEVDLFAEAPLPFEELLARSVRVRVGAAEVHVASIADLIAMKSSVGRPQDLEDIAALKRLEAMRKDPGS